MKLERMRGIGLLTVQLLGKIRPCLILTWILMMYSTLMMDIRTTEPILMEVIVIPKDMVGTNIVKVVIKM